MSAPGGESVAKRLARVAGRSTCRLTHVGRQSGRPHEVTVWFLVDGDTVYLVTKDMRRQWTRNVQARPEVVLRVDGETLAGDVEVVTDAALMAHVVGLLRRKYWAARLYLWFGGKPDGAFRVRVRATPS